MITNCSVLNEKSPPDLGRPLVRQRRYRLHQERQRLGVFVGPQREALQQVRQVRDALFRVFGSSLARLRLVYFKGPQP
jgi:hypothetical protein